MASRRFQAIRSSSQGEMGLFNQMMTIEPPTPISKRPALVHSAARRAPKIVKESKPGQQPTMAVPGNEQQQQPRKIMFTLGLTEKDNETHKDNGFGVFVQDCSLCKKKLKLDKNIYMYGYLGAFCSPDCRGDRIALDGIDNELVPKVPINMAPSKRF